MRLTFTFLMLLVAVPSLAANEATKIRSFDAQPVNAVVLKAGVGDVRVELSAGDTIDARVTLKAKRNTGIFSSLPDVEKIDISATMRGDQLELDVDSKNIEEQWVLRLPRKILSALDLQVGVGDVKVVSNTKRVELDLGVGKADIDAPTSAIVVTVGTGDARVKTRLDNAGDIDGTTGVGEVSLKGLDGNVRSRAVGGRVTGNGRGSQPIEVTVGVGDLEVELTPST